MVVNSDDTLARANELLQEGRRDEAGAAFRAILAATPKSAAACYGLGVVAWLGGRLDEARARMQEAVALGRTAMHLSMLGEIERMRGDYVSAQSALRAALELDPHLAGTYNNFGMLMLDQGRYTEAASLLMTATQVDPGLEMAHYNLGIAFKELNYLDEAIDANRKAIALRPDFVEAHVNLAIALLADGQLEEGFEEYEWRLRPPFAPAATTTRAPLWDGTVDPKGTLLIVAEQGIGDIIQFIRYLTFIAREGMRVIVQCPPALEGLLQAMEGIASTYRPGEPLPPHDAYIPLLSLPHLFQTRIDKIPTNLPYFLPPFGKVGQWRERLDALGETIKVGLRWSGNPANSYDHLRSIPLDMFSGLAGMDRVTFIGLNNEPLSDSEREAAARIGLIDVSADLPDFIDTAALLTNLDLVIAVDTAVLHLAGALGRPAWGLLRFAPHWPWLLGRQDSPWYPTLRLYRQPQAGDWGTVVREVVTTLSTSMLEATRET
jgi:Flp pilus assembly protein TadD